MIQLADLRSPEKVRFLEWAFTNPENLRPNKTREGVTADAARALAMIAQQLRSRGHEPRRVAHFLNKLVFSMFVEDENVALLPERIFAEIVEKAVSEQIDATDMLRDLFSAMRSDKGRFGTARISWFNGGLFDDDDVLPLHYFDVRRLVDAARLDWPADLTDDKVLSRLLDLNLARAAESAEKAISRKAALEPSA